MGWGNICIPVVDSCQFISVAHSCLTLFDPINTARQVSLSITNSWSIPILMFIESVMPSNHLILCHPFVLLPSVFPSIRVFSNELAPYIRWPKYWSFSFSISPSSEYSGLISFRIDWFDLLVFKKTLNGASLVVQWLRIHLPIQGIWV